MLLVECEEKQKIGQNKKMVTREIFPVVHIALIFIHQKYYLSQRVSYPCLQRIYICLKNDITVLKIFSLSYFILD